MCYQLPFLVSLLAINLNSYSLPVIGTNISRSVSFLSSGSVWAFLVKIADCIWKQCQWLTKTPKELAAGSAIRNSQHKPPISDPGIWFIVHLNFEHFLVLTTAHLYILSIGLNSGPHSQTHCNLPSPKNLPGKKTERADTESATIWVIKVEYVKLWASCLVCPTGSLNLTYITIFCFQHSFNKISSMAYLPFLTKELIPHCMGHGRLKQKHMIQRRNLLFEGLLMSVFRFGLDIKQHEWIAPQCWHWEAIQPIHTILYWVETPCLSH